MISTSEKKQILQLLQSPTWKVVENVVNEMVNQIKEEPLIKDSDYETLKTVHMNEGRVRGLRSFIQEMYNLASKNDERGMDRTAFEAGFRSDNNRPPR